MSETALRRNFIDEGYPKVRKEIRAVKPAYGGEYLFLDLKRRLS